MVEPAFDKVPLVLVSGMLCDRSVWASIAPELGDIAQIIPVDIGAVESVEAMADHLLDIAPTRFALAGHSLGGRVVLEVVRRAPERVGMLGLIGTAYRGRPAGEAGEQEAAMRHKMVETAESEGLRAYAERWVERMVHPDRLKDRALIDPIVAMVERVGLEALRGQVKMGLSRPDSTDLLPRISVPTLVLCARQDVAMPVAIHEEMAKAIPNATLTVIEHSGHMMMLERPDETAEAIKGWLTRWSALSTTLKEATQSH